MELLMSSISPKTIVCHVLPMTSFGQTEGRRYKTGLLQKWIFCDHIWAYVQAFIRALLLHQLCDIALPKWYPD